MKANEIRIGDWLYYKGQFNAFPFKVESITKKKVGYHAEPNEHRMYYLRLSECKPIPLVPEILEKNGFVPKFSDGCLTEYLIYKDIVDGLHKMYMKIAYFNTEEKEHKLECFDCRTGGCQIWIKFVHQLQHALRLCGIEKEIEL